jgi:site-specific DNA-cytosine methylase
LAYLRAHKTPLIIFENVPLMNQKTGNESIFTNFEEVLVKLTNMGYRMVWKVLDPRDVSVPNRRGRLWYWGVRETQGVSLRSLSDFIKP